MTPGPHLSAAAIRAPHYAKVWQSPCVLLENGRGFVGRSVVDDHPGRGLHRLRRHTVERTAKVLGLVAARRDEQVASRGVHAEKLIGGGRHIGKIPDLTRIDDGERETELDRAAPKVTSNRRWLEHGQSWHPQ